jgi:hypothetical protein
MFNVFSSRQDNQYLGFLLERNKSQFFTVFLFYEN